MRASLKTLLAKDRSGSTTIFFALSAVITVLLTGIAVDYLRAMRVAQVLQEVTDAAALAAAGAQNISGSTSQQTMQRTTIAQGYIQRNVKQVTDATVSSTPTITVGTNSIAVALSATVTGSFSEIWSVLSSGAPQLFHLSAKSTAAWGTGKQYICMLVLNPSASSALALQGTADINAKKCLVWVNSSSLTALYENGVAYLTALKTCVVGNYSGNGYSPTPKTSCTAFSDPLAAQYASDSNNAYPRAITRYSDSAPMTFTSNVTTTINPGIYAGGMTIGNNVTVQMNPGVYFIKDGTFWVKSGGILNGSGVTIILIGKYSNLDIQAGGNVSLTAPASGYFAGIALAQDATTVIKSTAPNWVIGGGTLSINGAIYFPNHNFYVTGNGTSVTNLATNNPQFAIIADTITLQGNGQMNVGVAADSATAGLPALPSANSGTSVVSLIQ